MALFTIPPRPTPLQIWKTCVYKTIGTVSIPIDIYLPNAGPDASCPTVLFIHGGGWAGSNRSDYCRPLFSHLLSLNFITASMDYRLVPETSFAGQLEDVRDVEDWLRRKLPEEVKAGSSIRVDAENILVVGASAGAHLALMIVSFLSYSCFTPLTPHF